MSKPTMKIIHVPIERIPNRYTADWVNQFETEFKNAEVDFVTVGDKEIPIETGSVLDAYGTNKFKLEQLIEIINMIKRGEITKNDTIFFADLWFPGLETLFYIRNMTKIEFKIAGVFHAGTWDPFDFTSRNEMRNWGQHLELSWLQGVDTIFVATQWHKDLIVMNSGDFNNDKIFVTGIPFYSESLKAQYPVTKKEDIIIFPHRMEIEKHPEKFDKLKKKYPQWTFIKTLDVCSNRDEYFKLLAKSKVMISFAQQETFGYSTVESMALGNYVIVPNSLSYRETVPEDMRYSWEKEITAMLEKFMSWEELPIYSELTKWSESIGKMIKVMQVKMREANRRKQEETQVRKEQLEKEEQRQVRQNRLDEAQKSNEPQTEQ